MTSESDLTYILYFYSATAQTLGAVLGIGIVALTFYTEWMNQKKIHLRDMVKGILNQFAYDVGKYSPECKFLEKIDVLVDKLKNTKNIGNQEKEFMDTLIQYQSLQILIPKKLFFLGLIITLLTIICSLAMLILINYQSILSYEKLIHYIVLVSATVSLVIFGRISWYAIRKL